MRLCNHLEGTAFFLLPRLPEGREGANSKA